MQEEEYFRSGDVVITRTLARFGGVSYAISNISLVRLGYERKLNPTAVILIIIGVLTFVVGLNQVQFDDSMRVVVVAGAILAIVGGVVQKIWPKKEYTFILKANSGDAHSFTIENADFATKVKAAIEEAIALRL